LLLPQPITSSWRILAAWCSCFLSTRTVFGTFDPVDQYDLCEAECGTAIQRSETFEDFDWLNRCCR